MRPSENVGVGMGIVSKAMYAFLLIGSLLICCKGKGKTHFRMKARCNVKEKHSRKKLFHECRQT